MADSHDARGRKLSNRQRKKLARRNEIWSVAGADPAATAGFFKYSSATIGPVKIEDDDVIRGTKVYNAVKIEIETSKRKPFNADNKLIDPPCRFKEDSLEPFLLRIAERLRDGTPRIAFPTGGAFASPNHKSWDAFITAMLATNLRALMSGITLASKVTG